MATININQNPEPRAFSLFGNFLRLPPAIAPLADGFLTAIGFQLLMGAFAPQIALLTTIEAAVMFSVLAAGLIGYQSFQAPRAGQRVLLRAAAMLLFIEALFVLFGVARVMKVSGLK